MELAEARGVLYARCRCGWVGTRYEVRVIGRDQALREAERDAVGHEDSLDEGAG
ncbi:MAG: hypothetical protein ACRDYX_07320 [Egibacteraceae bacterium]